jgi:predicted RNA-binding Zn ribbon-like protein
MNQYGQTDISRFDTDTNILALSFANTADWHAREEPEELLLDYSDLLTWGRLVGVQSATQAGVLLNIAAQDAKTAEQTVARAIVLREAIYRLFVAAAHGQSLPGADLDLLNEALPAALAHRRLEATNGRAGWRWVEDSGVLDQVLWPVIYSAAELLASEELSQVGQCLDDRGCGWLYLDKSRNHSRRWCSMDRCGNRAKAQRHYQRVTGKTTTAGRD